MSKKQRPTTLAVIVGNRGFFPGHLAETGREIVLQVLEQEGIRAEIVNKEYTNRGAVETYQEARIWAGHLKSRQNDIDGILITLPNFGEERGIADAIRLSGLKVPILVHAFPDDPSSMTIRDRRDSFCGKMSVCNNLRQYGYSFSLTEQHTVDPRSESFLQDLRSFAAVCRIVSGLRGVRLGAIGARPAAFNTVRYSETLLEQAGITVDTLDLSEVFGRAEKLRDNDPSVEAKLRKLAAYAEQTDVTGSHWLRMAKLAAVIEDWVTANELAGTAIQCWTAMENYFGIAPCTVMSLMSQDLLPSACETDVPGLVGMYALQLASGKSSALLDWNNNFGDDPDKGVVFHCGNLPKDWLDGFSVGEHPILSGSLGGGRSFGALSGRIKESPFTYLRVSTDDLAGRIRAYVGEGAFTGDPLMTFGSYGVVRIGRFQQLLRHICENGFEHHVSANPSLTAAAVEEALGRYLKWDVYRHP